MIFKGLFGKKPHQAPSGRIYAAWVTQAREPWFYAELGVPDTVEGRFEMIALHGFLVLHRLKAAQADGWSEAEALSQAVFDLMFHDMDRNLREMGTGDIGVAHRVKALIKSFYGRIAAYEEGLADAAKLDAALVRNVYGGAAPDGAPAQLADYLRDSVSALAALPYDDLRGGRLVFAALPASAAAAQV